jgi:PST family polysaccharide transporter
MEVFDSRKVLKNFISLGIAKGGDLLLPLMLVPLLISVLGVELYGVVAIAMACIGLVGIVVEFGFNLTATKRISQNQTKTNVVNKVFADVIAAKLALAFFSSIIYAVLVNFFVSGDDKFIYLTFIFVPFGAAMLPLWLFSGF